MAFASSVKEVDASSRNRVVYGEFSQGNGDTGGVVATGLYDVKHFTMTGALNLAISDGDVTVTTADPTGAQAGHWMAVGL